jgi:hypothetical protein
VRLASLRVEPLRRTRRGLGLVIELRTRVLDFSGREVFIRKSEHDFEVDGVSDCATVHRMEL